MFRHNFEFGTTPLVIVSEKVLEKELLDKILAIIQFIKYDFTDTVHNSSGYNFNKAKIGIRTLVSPEFKFYLKIINEAIRETNSIFFPFENIDPNDYSTKTLEFDENYIIKNSDFKFQTQSLLLHFLIDTIYDALEREKVKSFFIYSSNVGRAKGENEFEKEFSIEDQKVKIKIKDEAIGLFYFPDGKNKKFPKVAMIKKEDVIKHKFVILTSDTAIGTKLTCSLFKELYSENDYKYFAMQKNIRIWIYDYSDRKFEFS